MRRRPALVLRDLGFRREGDVAGLSEVSEPLPGYPDQWSLKSEQANAVLDPAFVRHSTDLFEAVAARHGGEYDGWEASV